MTDEDAFRAALRTTPGDRTARLVYADWLDERGRSDDAQRQLAAIDAGVWFRAWLNVHPADHECRAVYAAWLAHRGDRRADGLAALARLGCAPRRDATAVESERWQWQAVPEAVAPADPGDLPEAWVRLLPEAIEYDPSDMRAGRPTPGEAFDAAVRAWARLTPRHRAAIPAAAVPA